MVIRCLTLAKKRSTSFHKYWKILYQDLFKTPCAMSHAEYFINGTVINSIHFSQLGSSKVEIPGKENA